MITHFLSLLIVLAEILPSTPGLAARLAVWGYKYIAPAAAAMLAKDLVELGKSGVWKLYEVVRDTAGFGKGDKLASA